MLLLTAIAFGFFGSLHCLGMCAPLLWAVPAQKTKKKIWIRQKIFHNVGRIVTYSLLGLLAGLVGESFNMAGLQQYLSVAAGLLLLVGLSAYLTRRRFKPIGKLNQLVRSGIARYIGKKSVGAHFGFGLFNGLLPCGLVYMALLASLSMETISGSVIYMLLFGFGTLPMMVFAVIFQRKTLAFKRIPVKRLYPIFVFAIALLLLVRGMNLGIPYLSPKISNTTGITICDGS